MKNKNLMIAIIAGLVIITAGGAAIFSSGNLFSGRIDLNKTSFGGVTPARSKTVSVPETNLVQIAQNPTGSGVSQPFPKIFSVSFVSNVTLNGVTTNLPTELRMGPNNIVGIVAVATEPQSDIKSPKTILKKFNFTPATSNGAISTFSVRRLGGTNTSYQCPGGVCTFSGDTGHADMLIDNGANAYYVIETEISTREQSSVQITFRSLADQIKYNADGVDNLADVGVKMASDTLSGPVLAYYP